MSNYPSNTIEVISNLLFIGKSADELTPCDLAIVLGNNYAEGTMSEVHRLYTNKIITDKTTVILTGATGSLNAGMELECEKFFRYATEEFHMPSDMFIKESRATNAYLNFLYSKEIIEGQLGGFDSFNSILCVGLSFLLRRASMYASRLSYPADKMQYFGVVEKDGRNISKDGWWQADISIKRVMAEVERIGKYSQSGDLSIF